MEIRPLIDEISPHVPQAPLVRTLVLFQKAHFRICPAGMSKVSKAKSIRLENFK